MMDGDQSGSPPHTWGTAPLERLYLYSQRITPTHVGNGRDRHSFSRHIPDHPHTRGERVEKIKEVVL